MSSHHIVRDEQEPALIIENLSEIPMDLLGQLLEWVPVVVCGEAALQQALDYGINLDKVYLADSDKWSDKLEHLQVEINLIDSDWIGEVVAELSSKGHIRCNVLTNNPDSYFQTILESPIAINLVTASCQFVVVKEEIKKWMKGDSRFQIISDDEVIVTGAEKAGNEYVVKKEGMVTVSSPHAPFISGLTL